METNEIIQKIKDYVNSLDTEGNLLFQENRELVLLCFAKAIEIIEESEGK